MKKLLLAARRFYSGSNDKLKQQLFKAMPTESMFDVYKFILPVLKLIKDQSEMLCGEKYPTIGLVVPGIFKIRKAIEKVITNKLHL